MTNQYYNPTGQPASQTRGLSSSMRAEFASIGGAFDKIPPLGGLVTNSSNFGIDSGGVNSYVVAMNPLVISLTDGMEVVFKANSSNTGPSTVNVNGLGVKPIVRSDNSVLQGADIVQGQYVSLRYAAGNDNFQITSGISAPGTSASVAAAITNIFRGFVPDSFIQFGQAALVPGANVVTFSIAFPVAVDFIYAYQGNNPAVGNITTDTTAWTRGNFTAYAFLAETGAAIDTNLTYIAIGH